MFGIGLVSAIFVVLLLLPICVDYVYNDERYPVLIAIAMFYLFLSGMFIIAGERIKINVCNYKDILNMSIIFWVVSIFFGSIPFFFMNVFYDYIDCILVSTASICTTSCNIIGENESISKGLMVFKGEMQLLGAGTYILLVLDFISKITNLRYLNNYVPALGQYASYNIIALQQHSKRLLVFYALALLIGLSILSAGFEIPICDAFCYVTSLLSTSGSYIDDIFRYSKINCAFAGFSIFYMFIMGLPFLFIFQAIDGKWYKTYNRQLVIYCGIIIASSIMAIWSTGISGYPVVIEAVFSSIAAITNTWLNTDSPIGLISGIVFILALVGGCGGSASTGMTLSRYQVAYRYYRRCPALNEPIAQHLDLLQLNDYLIGLFLVLSGAILLLLACDITLPMAFEIAYKSLLNTGTINFIQLAHSQCNITGIKLIAIICMICSRSGIWLIISKTNLFR